MISVYPAFYKDCRCKADRCVHSCCMQNWDIDIDEATAMKYLVMTGEPGETIPVSYTHLDVYKRQASHLGTPLRFQHVYFRYSVVIIFFRNFMDYTPDKFCM